MPAFLAGPAAWALGVCVLPKKTRNLQENSQSSWPVDHPAGLCTVLGDMRLAAWEVQLDILHRNVRAGRNGDKHAMVLTRQDVLVVAAAAAVVATAAAVAATDAAVAAADAAVAAADASAAAAGSRGAVKPIGADTVRAAAKPTAVDDDKADSLCRRVCREHCHGLRGPVEPHRRAPGHCLATLYL